MKTTKLEIPIAGMKYRVSISTRRMMVTHVEEETVECLLVRDPENTHDENAVKVVVENSPYSGFHIGFVPATVAKHLAPLLDDITTQVAACVITEMDAIEGTAMLFVTLKTPVKAKKKKSR
jgi:hypothetical protein